MFQRRDMILVLLAILATSVATSVASAAQEVSTREAEAQLAVIIAPQTPYADRKAAARARRVNLRPLMEQLERAKQD